MTDEITFQDARRRICAEVRRAFAKIREDAVLALEDNRHREIQRQHEDLTAHLQRNLELHSRLLHDTLENYLADDALRVLDEHPSAIKNAYYSARATWLHAPARNADVGSLEFEDRRVLIAGGTGLAVLAGVRLLAISSFPLLVAIGSGTAAGFFAYRHACESARVSLGEAVSTYIDGAEATTLQAVHQAITAYNRTFQEFLRERSIMPALAAREIS